MIRAKEHGHFPNAPKISRIEVSGQTKLSVVSEAKRIGIAFETDNRSERTEGLLACYDHVLRHVAHHRGFIETPLNALATS